MTNKSNNGFNTWQKSFEKETKKNFSDAISETDEGINIKPVYTKEDLENFSFVEKHSLPGQWPYTRGPKASMYTNRPWTIRQYAGFSTAEDNQPAVTVHVLQGEREVASGNKSLGKFDLSDIPPAPRGIPQVQVAFDIDANGLLEVSATDRTTGRKQTVTISGGSNLNEQEINSIIEEAKAKANEDRKRRSVIDRKNSALTLIAQAERRLRDASLEFGPYGAERQQRAVELAIQDVEEYLDDDDPQELEISVSALQEALFGLNKKFAAEKKTDNNPLQGIKNTFGSLKDELFSDDYWDDDPWDNQMNRNYKNSRYGNSRDNDPWDNDYFL